MGHRFNEHYYLTLAEAEAARDSAIALSTYQETYFRGIFPVKLYDPVAERLVDWYKLSLETYYG